MIGPFTVRPGWLKRVAGAVFAALLCFSCATQQDEPDSERADGGFHEVAREAGLTFDHFVGATGDFLFPETTVPGVALFDFDNDGDLDVYTLQGSILDDKKTEADSLFPVPRNNWPGNRLFENRLVPDGNLKFDDVTDRSGTGHRGYSNGAAVADYDGDGDLDLYVTCVRSNVLYRNNGDGTFTDATQAAGAGDDRWSTSASFFDYDRDGHLDLFVVNYVDFSLTHNKSCRGPGDVRDYCGPLSYEPLPDRLLRNNGDGTFTDVSGESGILMEYGSGLGVLASDFDGDGWLDAIVANDGRANQFWHNNQDGTFEEMGMISATAYNADGRAEASMGIAAGDIDGDGDDDILMSHLATESNTLYLNDGTGMFTDVSDRVGLAAKSMPYTGFGTAWLDYNNDTHLDLFVANGAVTMVASQSGDPFPYRQPNLLFRNTGEAAFEDVTASAGPALAIEEVSRGAAFGDIDNDGDVDVVVGNCNGPLHLLENRAAGSRSWLRVGLKSVSGNRHGVGSRVAVVLKDGRKLWRCVRTDGSYSSANDLRLHFGLGDASEVTGVLVKWLGGEPELFTTIEVNSSVLLREGTGTDPRSD